jgi:hypothetical protein
MWSMMAQSDLTKWLRSHGACYESLTWLDAHADLTPQELWESCPRGDWLAWALEAAGLDVPASARRAYDEAVAPAYRAYDEARAAAGRAYGEACASARRAYYKASAGRALDVACASAEATHDEACASARRAYAVAIRAKVSFDDVLKGCGA